MARRRFIQRREAPFDFVEVTDDYVPAPRTVADAILWNDRAYDNLKATDGADIGSRTKHRTYMRDRDLTTIDDYKGEWAKARQDRDAYFTGKKGTVTREDVARAIDQLERRK